ncbi:hypothetical protein [Jeotgalibacillus campisalis]|uniref:Uncharacterized protein n=1 Tax=Jeotgalibacillus campisalis TaxID=220754 RepID=A0A0C2QYE2_9BACL|nr:hypothetical protein [Jeotgalibacillus campisalis]KIL43030.1 hypothetical protein KR50_34330 [Jeotgalibacillus campisalis]
MKNQEFLLTLQYLDDEHSIKGSPQVIEHHLRNLVNHLSEDRTLSPSEREIKIKINIASPGRSSDNSIEQDSDAAASDTGKKEIVALLEEIEPTTEWLYVLSFSYYLSLFHQNEVITARTLSHLYPEAEISLPNNIHFSIFQCVDKGFLELVGTSSSQQAYKITSLGIKHVEDRIQYSRKERNGKILLDQFESDQQKKQVDLFVETIEPAEYEKLKKLRNFEEQLLLILYYLHEKGITNLVRTIMVYQILLQLKQYNGSPRTVQTALSRARPMVMKVKVENKIHYKLTEKGTIYLSKNNLIHSSNT